ncbi:malto-oligosyltrehalose synthase [Paraflavitalea soli]|uniref:Malto-oligosyltrehalose synthase n=1 Tax=Paraflavitalea soli TaxID=2315862 RepID=A0A3B7MM73_9BACT|nr:malto-oligosyltrehalose synthase [Paraflavitalea soli]AXY72715.1 malto-oligosyltrehalose synthase [Paraflavitalea soli]
MYIPSATYRIQLHKGFTLQQLEDILGYLQQLGISTIYASPVTNAGAGSTHGYDVTDPHTINPGIGSLEELKKVILAAKQKGLGWLQDIVPNHMAFSPANKRLMDALERDALSEFHGYFDINWKHPGCRGKVIAPFLGDTLTHCIANNEIQIVLNKEGFWVQYQQQQYPLSLPACSMLLSVFTMLAKGKDMPRQLMQLWPGGWQNASFARWQQYKAGVFEKIAGNNRQRQQLEAWLAVINKDKELLTQLVEGQYYQLCHWQEVNKHINYRRFFTISSLISLRMEAAPVFNDYHILLHQLYNEGFIQGLRIDHIDGLYDPLQYTQQLRSLFGEDCYIVAEKILEAGEDLPAAWPLQGTTGYEFLAAVSQLLTNRTGGARLTRFYQSLEPGQQSLARQTIANKQLILDQYMQGEWDNLTRYFEELHLAPYEANWKQAIGALMVALPVYRLYPGSFPLPPADRLLLEEAIAQARQILPAAGHELDHLQQLFCGHTPGTDKQEAILLFLKKLNQYTGPLMAKGVEDTTFYTWNACIAHNEVGDTPQALGSTIGAFHQQMKARQQATPLSLNATATHDTKRGEDARLRINMLSEMPGQWELAVSTWFSLNEPIHTLVDGRPAPTRNEEYFLYQAIIGGFPEDSIPTPQWIERLQQSFQKAIREAKVHTTWDQPHETYEQACHDFIHRLFAKDHSFLQHFLPFMQQVNEAAAVASLSQLLIKLTAPGIPDIYQGCELGDYSFVDPDNRRPVDYQQRIQYLQQVQQEEQRGREALFAFLRSHRAQGLEKLFLTWKALQFRRQHKELFIHGDYNELTVSGATPVAIAYTRQWQQQQVIVVASLPAAREQQEAWITLPGDMSSHWTNVLTGESIHLTGNRVPLTTCCTWLPVALLSQDS